LPEYDFQVGQIPGFIPATSAILLICDLITAAILYAQAAVFRSRALTILASGYLLSGLLFIPYALTFPGAFSPKGLLGAGLNTTGWIAVCWRITTPVAILLYALLKQEDAVTGSVAERPPGRILFGVAIAVAVAVLVTLVTTLGHDMLPPFFVNESVVIRSVLVAVNVTVLAMTLAAIVILFRQRISVLDLWLLVAMSCWLGQSVLNAFLRSRFSLGAYFFFALAFLSNLIVMLALITESNRLYARLAVSTAARDREREVRLMSMDAVAAAIAHEVGQPLTAARLSTSAALKLLTGSMPDAKRAIKSLRETLDSEDRTFDVIRSLRVTFGNGAGTVSEFSLNDLARETVSLMDRELAAHKIALQLSLEDKLPSVLGNRVQIQRVIINLLTNAIESIVAAGSQRRIVIRSTSLDELNVQLDVSDSGAGITPEEMGRIFEPFFTTKATGTGLGLSLSRTVIEEHGGRLWASAGEDFGATFHLQLKRRPEAT
jgi:signal transduction histidine kinase